MSERKFFNWLASVLGMGGLLGLAVPAHAAQTGATALPPPNPQTNANPQVVAVPVYTSAAGSLALATRGNISLPATGLRITGTGNDADLLHSSYLGGYPATQPTVMASDGASTQPLAANQWSTYAPNPVGIPVSTVLISSTSSGGPASDHHYGALASAPGNAAVTYGYGAIPKAASTGLMLLGASVLARRRRRIPIPATSN